MPRNPWAARHLDETKTARRVGPDIRSADPLDCRDVGTFTPRKRASRRVSQRAFLPSHSISVGKVALPPVSGHGLSGELNFRGL